MADVSAEACGRRRRPPSQRGGTTITSKPAYPRFLLAQEVFKQSGPLRLGHKCESVAESDPPSRAVLALSAPLPLAS